MGVYQVGVPALGQFAAWCPSKIHATQRFGQMFFFELNCAGSICMQCMKEKKTRSPSAPHNAKRFLKKGGEGRGKGVWYMLLLRLYTKARDGDTKRTNDDNDTETPRTSTAIETSSCASHDECFFFSFQNKTSFRFVRVRVNRPKKRLEATQSFFFPSKGRKLSRVGGGTKRREEQGGTTMPVGLSSRLTRLRHVVALAHCLLWQLCLAAI